MRYLTSKIKPNIEMHKHTKVTHSPEIKTDIQVNKSLLESEVRYRRLFETAKDGILILDFETGNITDANPFIINIIDYPLNEILGKKLWEIGLFSNKEESENAFIDLKKTGYMRFEDMPIQRRNGKITEVEFISNVYLVNDTKVIQCNVRDITERRLSEKRQHLTKKILTILSHQENWKQSVNDILAEIKNYTGIKNVGIRLRENMNYSYYVSMGFPEYFTQRGEFIYLRVENGILVYEVERNVYIECICSDIISGLSDILLPYYTKGGSFYSNNISGLLAVTTENERQLTKNINSELDHYQSVALMPLYSGTEIIGFLQLNDRHQDMFDIEMIEFLEKVGKTIGIAFKRIQNENKIKESAQSLKKQNIEYQNLNNKYKILNEELTISLNHIQNINIELNKAKARAEESDMLKTTFLANMSHEIRTPVNAIMGFSEFLLEPGLSKDKIKDFVHIIHTSSLQLMSIISDIMDISKIESGQITINSELVNINDLMNELFVTYKKSVEQKKLSLYNSGEHPQELIEIITDGNRVKQIFCNLLNNALKFTSDGEIEFGYRKKENFIEFYVKDSGIGIKPENIEIIFERFRQIESADTREYSGNGLGLSISKALVEKLGGNITVSSEYGKGSIFTFILPYTDGNKIAAPAEQAALSIQSVNSNEKTILIVEDEIYSFQFLEELLYGKNIKVLHAWDGKQAIEKVRNHSDISLVLMDIKLPTLDGYKATRFIKQIRPQLPVIAQTAYALSQDKEEALNAGCDNYLSKPINKDIFMDVINKYLS
jgi:PAS domain S-box-containing protein